MQATLNSSPPSVVVVPPPPFIGRAPFVAPFDVAMSPLQSGWLAKAAVGLQVVLLLAASAAIVYAMIQFRSSFTNLGNWGYLGVAIAEFGNSATVIIPTPAPAYTFAMGAVLNPLLTGVIGGVAAAMGEMIGYLIGASGRKVIQQGAVYDRFQALTQRWGGAALFAFAALPLPFDLAGIWAGTGRYPVGKFLVIVISGKVIKVTTVAMAGYYGLQLLTGS